MYPILACMYASNTGHCIDNIGLRDGGAASRGGACRGGVL